MSTPSVRSSAPRDRSPAPLRSALLAIYRAYEMLGLYPEGHLALTTAASDGIEAINDVLRIRTPLTIVISSDGLQMEGTSVPIEPALRPMVKLLDECDLAALDVVGPLNAKQFMALAAALRDGQRERQLGGQLAERLQKATDGRAWFRPFNFSNLSAHVAADLTTVRRTKRSGHDQRDEPWNNRLRALVMKDTFDPIDARIEIGDVGDETASDASGGSLRMEHIANVLRETPAEQQPVVAQRLRTLLSSLGENFRSSLFEADALNDVNAARDVADASAVLPPDELLQALEASAREGARPTNATVMLFNKLLNLFEGDPTRVQRLAGIYGQLGGVGAAQTEDGASAVETLGELLSTRSETNYNPNDYSSTLERITHMHPVEGDAEALTQTWDDDTLHAAEIAAVLAADASNSEDAGPWQFALRSLDTMIEQGRIDLIQQVLRAAHEPGRVFADPVRQVVDQVLTAVAQPTRVERFIQLLNGEGLQSPDGHYVFAQLGAPGINALLRNVETMSVGTRGPFIESVFNQNGSAFRSACEQLVDQHRLLLRLAGNKEEFSEVVRQEFLCPVLGHQDALIRGDAYALLDSAFNGWPQDVLLRGATETDTEIQRRSMVRLLQQRDEKTIAEVAKLLAGRNRRLNDYVFGIAANVLEQVGDFGIERLADAFGMLLFRPTPKRVKRALQLLPILKRHRKLLRVRWALRPTQRATIRVLRLLYRLPMGAPLYA